MVEVFKTNVGQERQAHLLLAELSLLFPVTRINFDLEDCDKILRIEADQVEAAAVVAWMQGKGFCCEVLE